MSLVRVPDRIGPFRKWVNEVTNSAELRFGSRTKASSGLRASAHKRRRRRKRRNRSRIRKSKMNS